MPEVVQLVTKLMMDSKEFNEKIDAAKEKIGQFAKTSESSFASFGFSAGTVAATAIGVLGFKVAEATSHLNELYETSRKIGSSLNGLQELQYAFESFGVSGDGVVRMVQMLNKSIGDAELGIGKFGDTFKSLNLDVGKLAQQSDTDRILSLSNAIGKLNDQTKQTAIARQLLGRQGADFLGAARGGLSEAIDSYKGTGATDEQGEQAHQVIETLDHVYARLAKIGYNLLSNTITWMTNLSDTVDKMTTRLGNVFGHGSPLTNLARESAREHGIEPWHDNRSLGEMLAEKYAPSFLNDQHGYLGGASSLANTALRAASLGQLGSPDEKPFDVKTSAQQISTAATKIVGLGDEAENAGKSLKGMKSDVGSIIEGLQKGAVDKNLKRILGSDLDPNGNGDPWDKNRFTRDENATLPDGSQDPNSISASDFQLWDADVKQLFENIKTYGDTKDNERNAANLKNQLNGLGDNTDVNTINDLIKYMKEQGPKKDEIEVTVHWEKGLTGHVKVTGDGQASISDATKSLFRSEAASMGK